MPKVSGAKLRIALNNLLSGFVIAENAAFKKTSAAMDPMKTKGEKGFVAQIGPSAAEAQHG